MATEEKRDQFSTTVGVRVKSDSYLRHMRAIWDMLGIRQVHGNREALDIGVRVIAERDAKPEDRKIIKQHLEAMDKS